MRHLLYLIGDELTINENFKNYIYRTYEEKFQEINEIRIQSKTDKDLPFLLENLLNQYDFITLFTSPLYYATIAKILATLNNDNLILKDEILVPDKAEFSKDSFMCNFTNSKINVIKTNPSEKLPHLLGNIQLNFAYFCIFGMDNESALLLLQTLGKSYEVDIKSSKLLDNLVLIKATCIHFGKLDGFLKSARNLFGQKMLLGKDPISFIVSKLLEKKIKISFAETCTGGLCANTLTQISKSDEIFEGSIISYCDRIKHEWLGINENFLENEGEASKRCVYFMLKGIFKTANPDFALAINGIINKKDQNSTLYIGAMFKDGTFIQENICLQGDKKFIQKQVVLATFCLLLKLKPEIFEI
ncbi:nicotinamide-nucleotide amidohydrolase family protein [Campylobacter sp. VicNov18]|uniref:CinA family protein n=1 Tax=Campylobacter bilis TaxID=2691918 RepID=UPI00130E0566|nr:CinA family protein [Campylobacter bilis]MPV63690.1 nicotinamide-nucleotide amidohydrolase family protein [Campylobacter hepaticus]MBM0637191.1 nicotinamide-nucleotide amidohydrolase family protein [Campylobacter bilis]MCC8277908.1 nicotinamide-nucleotide amidohydrolase family protein [Campylobacter bilis]MCC8298839.1 nicotinamide-nucleotide amidohydrolase family protein [Campylobacter bilis]MCC8300818.1 nicotinamide-nucleotide amidohydrolase family protein [Campylobacter bilis]